MRFFNDVEVNSELEHDTFRRENVGRTLVCYLV